MYAYNAEKRRVLDSRTLSYMPESINQRTEERAGKKGLERAEKRKKEEGPATRQMCTASVNCQQSQRIVDAEPVRGTA